MFKLNRILIFIVAIFSVVVIGEVYILYRYKNLSQSENSSRLDSSLKSDGDFEAYKNLIKNNLITSSIMTTQYIGTIQNIHYTIGTEKDGRKFKVLNFDLQGGKNLVVPFILGPGVYRKIKVYALKTSSEFPISLSDLKNGDNVTLIYSTDLKLEDSDPVQSVKEIKIVRQPL